MIELLAVKKTFRDFTALNDISCTIQDGEFISFLGPSGSGKSTLLNLIAGILPLTAGKITFDGVDGDALDPRERNIGFVFQNYALYPNMTVQKNIEFPLASLKIPRNIRPNLIEDVAKLVRIEQLMGKKPHELSGGEQQRVAIARALVKRPRLLLLDEPFSNLDPHLSAQMRGEIKKLQLQLNITTIMVTHNQAEAMELSDRIALLSQGNLMQVDSTDKVYSNPENLFCAQFLGDVRINTLYGTMKDRYFHINGTNVAIPVAQDITGSVVLCVRPENIGLRNLGCSGNIVLRGKVVSMFDHGREMIVNALIGDNEIRFFASKGIPTIEIGQIVELCIEERSLMLFDTVNGKRIKDTT